ncbi:MAG: alanine acetyltransferase [Phyllobacteriaceae bacterium]|nr:alanine acetyltransferase [Phyllobacteriaceae bacterium]MBA89629.1 alanine acetyltransferase [Phyllobacteriaceae bacterium]|tara:strand:- start:38 stop:511 length:474 start_codon:yes stop_codon:yes gene_type:complete
MKLEGSCHCGSVRFSCQSDTPVPYQRCYCSICRKTQGGGGYAINLKGAADTLVVEGREMVSVYHAVIDGDESPAARHFCARCGSALWLHDPRWPDLVHPFASAIDTPLPKPRQTAHIMLAFKPAWVEEPGADATRCHDGYPDESIAQWHERTANRTD